eukprot:CAMPEP_0113945048 /NCGR_PEP_ID=MMETSP1339-20121228/38450_1 /TAXON_ID=94617 /ORGANISM="Fibrocapsa japonica" /LENGTH=501 /DNA_ID=CAMNT_0000950445 /DNA_START=26 /DNA_END=1531 /DNA_ORIENTATION=- /assembly_acc=CAM_ASM_000762
MEQAALLFQAGSGDLVEGFPEGREFENETRTSTMKTAAVVIGVAVLAAASVFAFSGLANMESSSNHSDMDQLREEISLLRTTPEFAACNDPFSTFVNINPSSREVRMECGTLSSVKVDRDNGIMHIDIGGEKTILSKDNPTLSLSEKSAVGLVQMSHVLGLMGYNGKAYPETMPLHFSALSMVKSGLVTSDMLKAIKAVAFGAQPDQPDHRKLYAGPWNGNGDPYDCPAVEHGPGGNPWSMDPPVPMPPKTENYCGYPNDCMPSVCGDCCFHVGCYGYSYCCTECSDSEKALIPGGMTSTCAAVDTMLAFDYECDAKYPDFDWCRGNCQGGTPSPGPSPTPAPASTPAPTPVTTPGQTCPSSSCETAMAFGDTTLIQLGITDSRWGWEINIPSTGSGETPVYAGAAGNDITKGYYIGDFKYTFTNEANACLTATFTGNGCWTMSESHLWFSSHDVATIAFGQWTAQQEYSSGSEVASYHACLDSPADSAVVAFHAAVCGNA